MSDIELHYTEYGEGFPLVLLHGNGEESGYFKAQIPAFSERCRVIAVDTRGHGETPRGTAPFTLAQFAEDLRDFLDSRGIDRAHILGFSDGGNIALLFALRYPQYVERLILNGADISPRGVRLAVQLPICLGWCVASLAALFDRKAAAKRDMLGLMVTQPHIDPAELAALRMPTLVIAGTRDMIRRRHTLVIARSIPGAEARFIPGDHFIAARQSGEFNRAVLEFLEK